MTEKDIRPEAQETNSADPPGREAIHRLRAAFSGLGLLEALREGRAEDLRQEEAKLDRMRRARKS